jgi:YHS domain-containing protein/limonene-1,2-epoxide hydrolase
MTQAAEIVERFLRAFYRGDADTARQLLADDLSFRGPTTSYERADDYLKVIDHAARSKGLDLQKIFADGPDVAVFYDVLIEHEVGRVPVAERYGVQGQKIVSIQMILDTGPFLPKASAQTATDPVCGMAVDMARPAATREHAGKTWYFCNPGCAEQFAREPDRYT